MAAHWFVMGESGRITYVLPENGAFGRLLIPSTCRFSFKHPLGLFSLVSDGVQCPLIICLQSDCKCCSFCEALWLLQLVGTGARHCWWQILGEQGMGPESVAPFSLPPPLPFFPLSLLFFPAFMHNDSDETQMMGEEEISCEFCLQSSAAIKQMVSFFLSFWIFS